MIGCYVEIARLKLVTWIFRYQSLGFILSKNLLNWFIQVLNEMGRTTVISKSAKNSLILMCMILITVSTWAQEEQSGLKSIVVMEVDAKGVSDQEASTLTDRFRSELVQTRSFKPIERHQIEQVFQEQKLQVSGTVSDEKLVEIGELLGAELLVIGSIGKLGSTYTIDLRLVDVQSGEITASYFKDHRGEVDGLLGLFRIIAAEIAAKESNQPSSALVDNSVDPSYPSFLDSPINTTVPDLSNVEVKKYDMGRLFLGNGLTIEGTKLRITPDSAIIQVMGQDRVFLLAEITQIMAKEGKAKRYALNCAAACVGCNVMSLLVSVSITPSDEGEGPDLFPMVLGSVLWGGISYGAGYLVGQMSDAWQVVYLSRG